MQGHRPSGILYTAPDSPSRGLYNIEQSIQTKHMWAYGSWLCLPVALCHSLLEEFLLSHVQKNLVVNSTKELADVPLILCYYYVGILIY